MRSNLPPSEGKPTKVMFVCRGSTKDGLGHVIRSREVAQIMSSRAETLLACMGDPYVENLLRNRGLDYRMADSEEEVIALFRSYHPAVIVFDLLNFDCAGFTQIADSAMTVSLSPVFNCLSQVDILYHRTRYWNSDWKADGFKPIIRSGLDYAVVSDHCHRISDEVYRKNLELGNLSIAISMGGADAANKTLQVLGAIKDISERLVIWVMLGEGYTHSYQDLVNCMSGSSHEVILAKSNDSMWRILSTCSLAILSGGTTTYEATYAGLPSINLLGNKQSQFLIQELIDRGVALVAGQSFEEGLAVSRQLLRDIYHDRGRLLTMQQNMHGLIDKLGGQRIVEDILRLASSHRPFSR